MGTATEPKRNNKYQRGYIASGQVELWCYKELIRVKDFHNKYQRKEIMRNWIKDLNTGTHNGKYYFIIKLDD